MTELFFILYQAAISLRILFEMEDLTISVFIHQLFWFNSVLMFFVICFRYILKVEKERLWPLSAGAFLTFIPLAYAKLTGAQWTLNYIQPTSFKQVFFDLATLLFSHEYNWPMFPELFALLTGSIVIGWILSKNIKRSIICSVTAVYGSFLMLGFSWISVNPEHPSLIQLRSGFDDSKFYAFQLITYFSILAIAAFHRELINFFKNLPKQPVFIALFIATSLIIQITYLYFFSKNTTIPDFFVTILPACSIVLTVFIVSSSKFQLKTLRYSFLPLWIALFSIVTAKLIS